MRKRIISIIIAVLVVVSTVGIRSEAANGVWRYSSGGWWYEYANGSYAHNEYVDGYWLNSAGWYDSAWNGSWKSNSKGWWFQSGSWYPCNQWLKIDGGWYYFKSNGYMAAGEWVGNYYLKDSGIMAQDEWIGDYYVGLDGAWVPNRKKDTTTGNNQSSNNSNNSSTNNNNNNNSGNQSGSNDKICTHNIKQIGSPTIECTKNTEKPYDVCTLCGYIAPCKRSGDYWTYGDNYAHKHTDGSDEGSCQSFQKKIAWTKNTCYQCSSCGYYYYNTSSYNWNCSVDGHDWYEYGSGEICVVCGARRGYPKQTDKQSILE